MHIRELQQQDKQLLALQVKNPDNYVNLQLDEDVNDIICYKKDPTQPNWKIALPESMVVDTVKWINSNGTSLWKKITRHVEPTLSSSKIALSHWEIEVQRMPKT
jgi:hypothetical protein